MIKYSIKNLMINKNDDVFDATAVTDLYNDSDKAYNALWEEISESVKRFKDYPKTYEDCVEIISLYKMSTVDFEDSDKFYYEKIVADCTISIKNGHVEIKTCMKK